MFYVLKHHSGVGIMKKVNKFYILLVFLVSIVCIHAFVQGGTSVKAESVSQDGKYQYYLKEDGTVELAKYIGTDETVTLPTTLEGKQISGVSQNLFSGTDVVSVQLPEGYEKFDYGMFHDCKKLEKVVLPTDLTEISASMFSGCTKLQSIEIPKSVKQIRSNAFSGSGLKTIELPEGITFQENIFQFCNTLESVAMHGKQIKIQQGMFEECGHLKKVELDKDYTSLYVYGGAFLKANSLEEITGLLVKKSDEVSQYVVSNRLKYVGNDAFVSLHFQNHRIKEFAIEENTTKIPRGAFHNMTNLDAIKIPDSITVIGESAFEDCKNLKEVTLPNHLEDIERRAFYGTTSLKKIEFPSSLKSIGEFAFYTTGLSSLELPKKLEILGNCCFESCKIKGKLIVPKSVEQVGVGAFENNKELEEVDLYGETGGWMFENCTSIRTINLHGQKSIATLFAAKCSSLKRVTGVDAITELQGSCFSSCVTIEEFGDWIKTATNGTKVLTIPKTLKKLEKAVFDECNIGKIIVEDGVTSLKDMSFANYGFMTDADQSVKEIILPDSVTELRHSQFSNSRAIQKIHLSANIKVIPERCFTGCDALQKIVLSEGVQRIEYAAFGAMPKKSKGCNVYLPMSISHIDDKPTYFESDKVTYHVFNNSFAYYFVKDKGWDYKVRTDRTITSIDIKGPKKTSYVAGEKFDASGISVKITYNDHTTENVKDYKISTTGMKIGKQTGTITYQNETKRFYYTIRPMPVKKVVVSSKNKKNYISWNKQKNVTQIQIYRAQKRNGKYKLIKGISVKNQKKITDKNVKYKKKYYYKIRTYKKVNGIRYYSPFSKIVCKKTKK